MIDKTMRGHKFLCRVGLALSAWLSIAATQPAHATGLSADNTAAVALMYHRFGEDTLPATNIRLDQFEQHLKILAEGGYRVVALGDIVKALKAGETLPAKTVAITVDDAYASVLTEAWPRLKARGWPLTLFVATDPVDQKTPGYLTWDQIRQLRDDGVTIGAHSRSHAHMAKLDPQAVEDEIVSSLQRFRSELGREPRLMAYPYGEANHTTLALAARHFDAAFGQHSGVIHAGEDRFYLPRYALNETYGTEDRFKLVINTLPIPVKDVTPSDPTLQRNPPYFGFTFADPQLPPRGLNCFASSGESKTEILGNRIEIRPVNGFSGTRGRINCTMMDANGRWRWYGRLFYLPESIRLNNARDD